MDICSKCPTPINTFRLVSFQVQLSLELQVHHANHSQYQSGYNSVCILRYLSYKIQLHQELQFHHEYQSKYQSGYNLVCILRYLSYKIQLNQELKVHTNTIITINQDTTQSYWIQLNIILNLYPPFNRVIQDTSCSITKKDFSHTVITVEYYSN